MATSTTGRQIRYRASGEASWTYKDVGTASSINLSGLVRGTTYEVQVRNIDSSGRSSSWVSSTVTVGETSLTGAAAIPNVANQQAMWDENTSVSYDISSDSDGNGTATISVSAGDLIIGSNSYSYGASSASITGSAGTSTTIFLYYDDPGYTGGTLPLGITTSVVDTANADGLVAICSLLITYPDAGQSNSGSRSLAGRGGSSGVIDTTSADIADATSIGISIITAGSGEYVRDLIGAGTSNLQIGTISGTALAGDTPVLSAAAINAIATLNSTSTLADVINALKS